MVNISTDVPDQSFFAEVGQIRVKLWLSAANFGGCRSKSAQTLCLANFGRNRAPAKLSPSRDGGGTSGRSEAKVGLTPPGGGPNPSDADHDRLKLGRPLLPAAGHIPATSTTLNGPSPWEASSRAFAWPMIRLCRNVGEIGTRMWSNGPHPIANRCPTH